MLYLLIFCSLSQRIQSFYVCVCFFLCMHTLFFSSRAYLPGYMVLRRHSIFFLLVHIYFRFDLATLKERALKLFCAENHKRAKKKRIRTV